jgi:hypothetical protein
LALVAIETLALKGAAETLDVNDNAAVDLAEWVTLKPFSDNDMKTFENTWVDVCPEVDGVPALTEPVVDDVNGIDLDPLVFVDDVLRDSLDAAIDDDELPILTKLNDFKENIVLDSNTADTVDWTIGTDRTDNDPMKPDPTDKTEVGADAGLALILGCELPMLLLFCEFKLELPSVTDVPSDILPEP